MPQTHSRLNSLQLQLNPRQASELGEWASANVLEFQGQILLLDLIPGQITELVVHIESLARCPEVRWLIVVTGDFPHDWLPEKKGLSPADGKPGIADFSMSQDNSTEPRQTPRLINFGNQVEKILAFEMPENFFEHQANSAPDNSLPKLTYEAQISLYAALYDSAQNPESPREIVLAGFRSLQLRVCPHSTYASFLPAIYQSSDFTRRFLAIFEQGFDPTVQTMDNLWAYLDPLTAPRALLPFLAQWVAWPWDPHLDPDKQRHLLRHAITLYRCRGTRYGLRLYLHLYTRLPLDDDTVPESQKCISVVENHRPNFALGNAELAHAPMLGGGRPFHFTVVLRPRGQIDLSKVELDRLIDQIKPAYCTYDSSIEPPSLVHGSQ